MSLLPQNLKNKIFFPLNEMSPPVPSKHRLEELRYYFLSGTQSTWKCRRQFSRSRSAGCCRKRMRVPAPWFFPLQPLRYGWRASERPQADDWMWDVKHSFRQMMGHEVKPSLVSLNFDLQYYLLNGHEMCQVIFRQVEFGKRQIFECKLNIDHVAHVIYIFFSSDKK